MCRMISSLRFLKNFFATKHYMCVLCGACSSDASSLCLPIEQEFEQ